MLASSPSTQGESDFSAQGKPSDSIRSDFALDASTSALDEEDEPRAVAARRMHRQNLAGKRVALLRVVHVADRAIVEIESAPRPSGFRDVKFM